MLLCCCAAVLPLHPRVPWLFRPCGNHGWGTATGGAVGIDAPVRAMLTLCLWLRCVGAGLHFLTAGGHGSFAHAQQALENALSIDENNFPAILCQALMAYRRSDWVLARKLYIRALRIHPNCSAAVRVGLGMCLFKLGHVKAAKMAMERALELQPDNADALGALAVLERYHWTAGPGQDPREAEIAAVRSAMALANKGYNAAVQADRVHPVIWNQWAHFYFKKWAQLPAKAAVTQGSSVVRVDRDVTALVKEGHPIYVAQTAVYTVASATRTQITLTKPYEAASATGVRLDHRQFDKSMKLATEALGATSNNETLVRACSVCMGPCLSFAHHLTNVLGLCRLSRTTSSADATTPKATTTVLTCGTAEPSVRDRVDDSCTYGSVCTLTGVRVASSQAPYVCIGFVRRCADAVEATPFQGCP